MPIKPENRSRYPKDWPAISLAARARAGWKCQHQGCAARQYAVGIWRRGLLGSFEWDEYGIADGYLEARTLAAEWFFALGEEGPRPTVIVLTVAHLNHQPEDCRPENLAAMCQRHHLAYDAQHHKETAYATRRRASATADLFSHAEAA